MIDFVEPDLQPQRMFDGLSKVPRSLLSKVDEEKNATRTADDDFDPSLLARMEKFTR